MHVYVSETEVAVLGALEAAACDDTSTCKWCCASLSDGEALDPSWLAGECGMSGGECGDTGERAAGCGGHCPRMTSVYRGLNGLDSTWL